MENKQKMIGGVSIDRWKQAFADVAARKVIDGVARNLAVAYHNVVVVVLVSIYAHRLQAAGHHVQVAGKCLVNILIGSDVREHHVAHVGIHAAAPALTGT